MPGPRKNCLPCNVNGEATCKKCAIAFCTEHVYSREFWCRKTYKDISEHICFRCHRQSGMGNVRRKPVMTLQELQRYVRKIYPKEYLHVNVSINDHRPGFHSPTLEYGIYTSKHGHTQAATPETALKMFCKKLGVDSPWKRKAKDLL